MKIGPDKTGPGTFHDVKKAASTQDVSGLSGIELCYELHNQLTGYIDPSTPDDLKRVLISQSLTVDQIIAALQAASEREARADHSRTVYARALEEMRIALVNVHDHIEEDGDRVYFGSTNHADDLKAAWQLADALKWDEVMEDTQPKTELAAVNLRLQDELKAASEREAKLRERLELTGEFAEGPDGIECRDDTIKLLDARIAKLVAENAEAVALLEQWRVWSCGQRGASPFQDTRAFLERQALGREG